VFPKLAGFDDPAGGVDHGAGVEAAAVNASLFAARDEAGALEDAQVARDGGGADAVGGGEVADRGFAAGELADDAAADGIGEGLEDGVEGRLVFINH